MLYHYPEHLLNLSPSFGGRGTSAILARKPNGKAVVFIHGYGSKAITAWAEFNKYLPQSPGFEQYDFIFYGHDALYATTTASATLFCEFLNQLITEPSSIINSCLSLSAARQQFEYSKVILAAHSLGAVICRWALLLARDKGYNWMDKTALVLYAPAHMGARVVDLARETTGFLRSFVTTFRFASPLLDELNPESPMLKALQQKTADAINAGNSQYLIAKKVVIAEQERIVTNLSFLQDPPPVTFSRTTHTSVCKPKDTFLDPIEILSEVL
jgi:pimeloyl-ACP methyl ester carboxylesterase